MTFYHGLFSSKVTCILLHLLWAPWQTQPPSFWHRKVSNEKRGTLSMSNALLLRAEQQITLKIQYFHLVSTSLILPSAFPKHSLDLLRSLYGNCYRCN